MESSKYDALKLENQLCFPLYVTAKETVKLYRPFLEPFGLTYTQYITLMVVWEMGSVNVKELGERLYLDSGTLSPLLKCLENKGYIKRSRYPGDERVCHVEVTETGEKLKEQMLHVPAEMTKAVKLNEEEIVQLYKLLYKLLGDEMK